MTIEEEARRIAGTVFWKHKDCVIGTRWRRASPCPVSGGLSTIHTLMSVSVTLTR